MPRHLLPPLVLILAAACTDPAAAPSATPVEPTPSPQAPSTLSLRRTWSPRISPSCPTAESPPCISAIFWATASTNEWGLLEPTAATTSPFWEAGYQIHAYINGDLSAALFIDIIRQLQDVKPRFGHCATLAHFAFTSEEQCRQLRELGIVVSAHPCYHHILRDIFSDEWLGAECGAYLVRLGSLERLGVPFGLHSDSPMGPLSALTLARAAANRVTINGNLNGRAERASLDTALRAITIDAAWIMRREHEIGSIRAGKMADFAVLEQDPDEVGVAGLKEVPILGHSVRR